ncbi:MAG TPA: hypothetical protein VFZ86_15995 [Thermoleophilia bacterium]|nr:hypothetical protein [Thermoleophilia bacterium]
MGDAHRRTPRRAARALAVLLTALAALGAGALAGCGSPAENDPFVGYWVGGGMQGQMTLVQIGKDEDGKYVVLANPDQPAGEAVREGDSLVVDTHAVVMRFTPAPDDRLSLEFSGDMFEEPAATTLKRTDATQYSDAAVGYGLAQIERGLAMWKGGGGKKYPPPKEVTPSGLLGQMIRWPNNPFTGQPMQPGQSEGDYVYKQVAGGKKYSLKGYLSDGSTIGE